MDDSFGKTLRKLREKSEITLNELARRTNRSKGYLSGLENDNTPPPSVSVIMDICRVLNIDKKELLLAAQKMDPEISDYVAQKPEAADFLRLAKDYEFDEDDWERLTQLAKISKLGKEKEE